MVTLYDAPVEDLDEAVAERLADRIEQPAWLAFAKAGSHRELPPEQNDFWYRRAASVLRKVATEGPIGVERLSTEYGGRKAGSNRYRVAPEHHADGSGKIIRTILQQLENEGLVDIAKGEGRRVTPDGRAFLDDVAAEVLAELDRPELERYV